MEIGFRNLRVSCIIGILDRERSEEQIIEADLMISIDVDEAVRTEDIGLTISYVDLAELFASHARSGCFQLLETLVGEFRNLLQQRYNGISGGSLEVRKPSALADADAAVVRLRW